MDDRTSLSRRRLLHYLAASGNRAPPTAPNTMRFVISRPAARRSGASSSSSRPWRELSAAALTGRLSCHLNNPLLRNVLVDSPDQASPGSTAWPNRPAPPVTSAAYAQALNEVKSLGQDVSTTRTADQTAAAKFWAAAPI